MASPKASSAGTLSEKSIGASSQPSRSAMARPTSGSWVQSDTSRSKDGRPIPRLAPDRRPSDTRPPRHPGDIRHLYGRRDRVGHRGLRSIVGDLHGTSPRPRVGASHCARCGGVDSRPGDRAAGAGMRAGAPTPSTSPPPVPADVAPWPDIVWSTADGVSSADPATASRRSRSRPARSASRPWAIASRDRRVRGLPGSRLTDIRGPGSRRPRPSPASRCSTSRRHRTASRRSG